MLDFQRLNPEDYLRIFWKRIWYFLITAAVVSTGGIIYAWRMPSIYQSVAKIYVETPPGSDLIGAAATSRMTEIINQTRSQLTSRSFLTRIVEEFQPAGTGRNQIEGAVTQMQTAIQVTFDSASTFTISFSAGDAAFAHDITRRLTDELIRDNSSKRLSRAVEAESFIDGELEKTRTELAAVENRITEFKIRNLGFLPEQAGANITAIGSLNNQLTAVENALKQAQDQKSILEIRIEEETRFARLRRDVAESTTGSPQEKPQVAESREILNLRGQIEAKDKVLKQLQLRYTAQHPDVRNLTREIAEMDAELKKLRAARTAEAPLQALGQTDGAKTEAPSGSPVDSDSIISATRIAEFRSQLESVQKEVDRREKEREELLRQIREFQSRLGLRPRVEQEYLALAREHDALRQQYQNMQAKKFNSQLITSLETSRTNTVLNILDEATFPDRPVQPNRRLLALMAVLAGLGTGLAVVFVREHFDSTLADEEMAERELQLPVLIAVPEVTPKRPISGSIWGRLRA